MKKILFMGNTAWSMYNFRRVVFSDLLSLDYIIYIVAPLDIKFQEELEKLGCKFISLEIKAKGTNPFRDFILIFQIKKILEKVQPDFCFFYTIKPNIYGSIAASMLRIPHIAIITGLGYTFINHNLISYIAKCLYKIALVKAKEVWFLNQDDKETFVSKKIVKRTKVRLLPGEGIDLNRFSKKPMVLDVSFLLMARMLWDKGIGEFVEAAKFIKQRYPDTRFCLLGFIGVDNPTAIPKEQIEEWCSMGLVEYLGVTSDVRPFIENCSCVVLPSYREGVPVSLLEGAAMGRPLITTDVAGCKEAVEDTVNGYLCKVKDVETLVSAMEKIILMSMEQRVIMGEAGRVKMQCEFDIKLATERYINTLHYYLGF